MCKEREKKVLIFYPVINLSGKNTQFSFEGQQEKRVRIVVSGRDFSTFSIHAQRGSPLAATKRDGAPEGVRKGPRFLSCNNQLGQKGA